jgi:hypothetical protein
VPPFHYPPRRADASLYIPQTAQKILFFRSMFTPGMLQSFLGIMQIFYYGDAYPEFPTGVRWLEWLVCWFHRVWPRHTDLEMLLFRWSW